MKGRRRFDGQPLRPQDNVSPNRVDAGQQQAQKRREPEQCREQRRNRGEEEHIVANVPTKDRIGEVKRRPVNRAEDHVPRTRGTEPIHRAQSQRGREGEPPDDSGQIDAGRTRPGSKDRRIGHHPTLGQNQIEIQRDRRERSNPQKDRQPGSQLLRIDVLVPNLPEEPEIEKEPRRPRNGDEEEQNTGNDGEQREAAHPWTMQGPVPIGKTLATPASPPRHSS